jgi:hypothetical protein
MHLNNISVCKACVKDAKNLKYPSEPFLFSDANNIDLGAVSEYLPVLTKVEEIITARVYVYLQVAWVCG